MTDLTTNYPISIVERDTGINRDTLRVWERRYGFPLPARNDKGERIYSEQQLRTLQRVRRLMDQGLRPGKLLPPDQAKFEQIENSLGQSPSSTNSEINPDIINIISAVEEARPERISGILQTQYAQLGMKEFVLQFVLPLVIQVGERWARGQLEIYQEHVITDHLLRFLTRECDQLAIDDSKPTVLLATLPGENHTLGLTMIAALLADQGMRSINLGSSVPMDQLARAATDFKCSIVGITFSGAYPYHAIRATVTELRELLADDVRIYIGGEGVRRLRKLPDGVFKILSLTHINEIS